MIGRHTPLVPPQKSTTAPHATAVGVSQTVTLDPIPETHIPAQIIRPARGRLEWLLDRDAASRLSPSALYHQPAKAATDGGYEPETIDPQITQMTQIVSEKSFREIGQSV